MNHVANDPAFSTSPEKIGMLIVMSTPMIATTISSSATLATQVRDTGSLYFEDCSNFKTR